MLHPSQFEVNEAWIAFRLNDAPLNTSSDGALNCVALMDAASCFLLASAFVATSKQMSKLEARHLLAQARKHKGELPKTLFIAAGCPAQHLEREAEHRKVAIARVPEDQLVPFIREARESFSEHFGGGRLQ